MKKIQLWMLAAILTICGQTVLTSCSDDDDNNNQTHGVPGTAQRDYKLDWKIVNDDRQLVALDGVMGNILRAELDQIQFEYTSVGPDMKTPVRLTGTINMPRHIFNKSEDPDQLLIYHQWTHAANFEKIFNDGYNAELGIYMNEDFNTIAISSDSYGWTLTKDKPQAYCSHEIQAVAQLDCYDAAMEILKQKGYKVEGLSINSIGYSSGGMLAVAIGSGSTSGNNRCGNIVIDGGVIVARTGGGAFGSGQNGRGVPAIGSSKSGSCGNITICGGCVTATASRSAPAIGCADAKDSSCGDVFITEGITSVTLDRDSHGFYIGIGFQGTCGSVTVDGVKLTNELLSDPDELKALVFPHLNSSLLGHIWTLTAKPAE